MNLICDTDQLEDKEAWNVFYRMQMQLFKGKILEEVRKIEEDK